jgi:Ras-related protein Rab-18
MPPPQLYDHLCKLILVGDSGVGKTSMLLRFVEGEWQDGETRSTVGVDLKVKMMNFRGTKLKLTIWDTAGQERFRTLTSAYYRGAHGIILVYDITDRKSFENVKEWLAEVDIYSTHDNVVKMLVGNKIDKESERVVSKEEGMAFARSNAMLFIESSAKTEEGVQQAFEELIQKILESPNLLEGETWESKGRVEVDKGGEDTEEAACC